MTTVSALSFLQLKCDRLYEFLTGLYGDAPLGTGRLSGDPDIEKIRDLYERDLESEALDKASATFDDLSSRGFTPSEDVVDDSTLL